jgi:uncharacterized protein YjbI with pentapeptide repeats
VDGRIDLRGFVLPGVDFTPVEAAGMKVAVATGKLPEIRKATLRRVDLSESSLRHLGLTGVRFEDCLLRGADLTHFRAWRCRFEGCDLSGADLTDAVLSGPDRSDGTTWRDCTFGNLVLDGVIAEAADFQGCAFDQVRIANMIFKHCSFTDCRITGSLENVTFTGANPPPGARPTTLTNLDLRDCRLTDVAFAGLRLAGVRLPARDTLAVVPRAAKALAEIRSAVAAKPGEYPFLEFWADYKLKHHGPDDDLFLDYEYIRESAGEAGEALVRDVISRVS